MTAPVHTVGTGRCLGKKGLIRKAMARIKRRGGAGTKKKKKAFSGRRNKRDLEDLYHSVVSAEKLKKTDRKKKQKELREDQDTENEYENPEVILDEAFAPVVRNDVTALLGLLLKNGLESESVDGSRESDKETTQEEEFEGDGMEGGMDEAECDVDERDGKDDNEKDIKQESMDAEREENLRMVEMEETDGEVESDDEMENPELWNGFRSESFNIECPKVLNSCPKVLNNIRSDQGKVSVTPPGFAPFLVSTTCQNASRIESLIRDLPSTPLDFLGKDPSLRLPVGHKLWCKWKTNVVPKLLEIETRWHELSNISKTSTYLATLQSTTLFQLISSYVDIIMSDETYLNSAAIRGLSILHIVNHLVRMRNRQAKNNHNLKKVVEQQQQEIQHKNRCHRKGKKTDENLSPIDLSMMVDPSGDDRFRDQGFTRAKVLIMTPTRQTAKDLILLLISLLPGSTQVKLFIWSLDPIIVLTDI